MTVLYYLPQKKLTTLSTPGGITTAAQTTGIKVADVTGVDITKPGILCLTWANPMDETAFEYITYTSIDGSNELQGVTRGAEGSTARDSHRNGAVVAWVVSKSHINNINDEFNSRVVATGAEVNTGTDNAKFVSPKAIADSTVTTATKTQSLSNKTMLARIAAYTPSGAGTTTLDLSTGGVHSVTMPANTQTLAISNATVGQCFIVEINNVTSQGALTWFTTIRWAGGSAPTLTGTNGKRDTFGFRVTGADTYDGYIIGQNI